jgi:hypothetical protein
MVDEIGQETKRRLRQLQIDYQAMVARIKELQDEVKT